MRGSRRLRAVKRAVEEGGEGEIRTCATTKSGGGRLHRCG
jgi:hypothetical protein